MAIQMRSPRWKVLAMRSFPRFTTKRSWLSSDTIRIATPTAMALPIIMGIVAPLTNSKASEELSIFVRNMRII